MTMATGLQGQGADRFHCQRCGWCCHNQLIRVFTVEIQAILAFLRHQAEEAFEDHISACLASEGHLRPYDYLYHQRLAVLRRFYRPYEVECFEGDLLGVKTHVITLLPETRRCVFYNPLTSTCFIYPARPLTCRMFPFEVKDGRLVMINEDDQCPGVGQGAPVNLRRHQRLSRMCQHLVQQEDALFHAFVREQGFHSQPQPSSLSLETRTVIDPFVERGLIPTIAEAEDVRHTRG